MALHLVTCLGVDNDLPYLPHFIRHYDALGVPRSSFRVIVQARTADDPGLASACQMLDEAGIAPAMTWIGAYNSKAMWERRRLVQQNCASANDHVISADVDELHEYPAPLDEVLTWCRANDFQVVQGPFIDRLAADGRLASIPGPKTPIAEAYPLQTELRHSIAGITDSVNLGGSVKAMILRGDVMPGLGGHGAAPEYQSRPHAFGGHLADFPGLADPRIRYRLPFLVHHYKWTEGLETRMRQRLDTPGISAAGKEYAEALLSFFDGRQQLYSNSLPLRDPQRHAARNWTRRAKLARFAGIAQRGRRRLAHAGGRLVSAGARS